jgi:hypothetical protein
MPSGGLSRASRICLPLVASVGLALAVPARADFAPPRLVSDGSGLATQTAMGLDAANNAYISSVIGEKIRVKVIGPDLELEVPIAATGLGQGDPDFETSSTGQTFMTFSQLDASQAGEGREIYITHNGGGAFQIPEALIHNRVDDYAPRVSLDALGEPHVVWAERVGETSHVLYAKWTEEGGATDPAPVSDGDDPQIFVDDKDVVHVLYSRANDLLYNNNRGGSWNHERRVTTTPFDPEASASLGGDRLGNILVAYESRSTLYFTSRAQDGSFRPPRPLDSGGILDPRMRVRPQGQLTLVYVKKGEIFFVQGQATSIDRPQQITNTPEVESHPSLEIDAVGNLHVSFLRDGEVYYTNNALSPVAEFAASPTLGEVPITVSFGDLSSGGVQVWEWDFGDGTSSTEQNPTHTYSASGKYTVSLRVIASGATEAMTEKSDFIFAQDPFNTLRLPDQRVLPGQKEVWFPVLASHKEPVAAFQLMATFDPNFLHLNRFEQEFTAIEVLDAEFFQTFDRGTYFEVGCAFEFDPPIDPTKQFLAPGQNQTILNVVFDVSDDAPQGAHTEIRLVNDFGLSPVFNIFTIDRSTRLPALEGADVEVLIGPPFPSFFLRGDTDGNGDVDITDAIRILSYLFTGGAAPVCLDAADVNDRGQVDISGAIGILSYLFIGGAAPAVPFPKEGPDPTPDELAEGC